MNELYPSHNALATGNIQPFMVTQADPYRDIAGTRMENIRNALTAIKGYFATGPLNQLAAATRLYQQAQREGRELTPEEDAFISQTAMDVGLNAATFIGAKGIARLGKTDILNKAKAMRDMGVKAEQIWSELGVTFGFADEMPRMEISDLPARLNLTHQGRSGMIEGQGRLSNSLTHESLFKSYPEVADMQSVIYQGPALNESGRFSSGSDHFTEWNPQLKAEGKSAMSPTLHELQHAIQQREGFARGGSPEQFNTGWNMSETDLKALQDEVSNKFRVKDLFKQAEERGITPQEIVAEDSKRWGFNTSNPRMDELMSMFDDGADAHQSWLRDKSRLDEYVKRTIYDPSTAYRSLAGESEARLTQARMNLTDAERLAQYPPAQFDVPVGEQIVRFGDNGPNLMTTYHGSPHTFDKFDHAKMGTGEGAQAYGWGTYVADSPDVAKTYARVVDKGGGWKVNEIPGVAKLDAWKNLPEKEQADVTAAYFNRGEYGAKAKLSELGFLGENLDSGVAKSAREIYHDFDKALKPEGSLYSVDLPDPHTEMMLDWDKPLSDELKSKLSPLIDSTKKSAPGLRVDEMTGGDFYRAYSAHRGGNQAGASQALNELGIPGIKYLDGTSRSAGAGTRNYVIFDPEIARIVERNGQPTGIKPWTTEEAKADLSKRLNAYIAGRK
jgi:hypothetical protein